MVAVIAFSSSRPGGPPRLAQAGEDEVIVPAGLELAEWVQAGVIVAVALAVAVIVYRVVVQVLGSGSPARLGVARLLGRLVGMGIFAGGVVYALNALGVRIGPLLGALGIVGIAFAFALQDILENFVAGVILQTRTPFRLGDQIVSGEWQGTVEDVNFRAVVLRTVDGTRVVLPSSTVLKGSIQNLSAFRSRRTTITVGVAYGTDLCQVAELITDVAGRTDGVLETPEVEVLVEELAESSVNLAVRFWHAPTIGAMWHTRHAVFVAVYDALASAGIEIPFPQRTISLQRSTASSTD
jgi:small conductance mechanosensitive channel